jgi:hypothetical protein
MDALGELLRIDSTNPTDQMVNSVDLTPQLLVGWSEEPAVGLVKSHEV